MLFKISRILLLYLVSMNEVNQYIARQTGSYEETTPFLKQDKSKLG